MADRLADRVAKRVSEKAALSRSDGPSTLPGVEHPAYANQAYYAVRLALARTWVTRRNETFTFLDADTVRRRMSIDFTLPESTTLKPGEVALIPLMLLAKHNLRNLDVRDGSDQSLPVLSTRQNGEAAVIGLAGLLEGIVERTPEHVLPRGHPDRLVDLEALREVVYASQADHRPSARHVSAGAALDRQLKHAEPAMRRRIEVFLAELERTFMLLVPVPYWPRQRQVFKVSYDAAIHPQDAPFAAKAYIMVNRFVSSFGLIGRVEFFDGLAVGLAESYHCEAVPPRDTYIAEAALTVRRPGAAVEDDPITDKHAFRPHLRAMPQQRGDLGKLSLIIHAHRGELLLPLTFSSVLITGALGFLPSHLYEVDGQTLAALLLVPFALSAFYIRSQENSYVTRMLRGVRLLAILPLVAAVWAIGLVALGVAPPAHDQVVSDATLTALKIPFLAAALPTAVLVMASFAHLVGAGGRRLLRAWQDTDRRRRRELAERAARQRKEPPRRWARTIVATLVATLALLLGMLALGYSAWRGASTWWDEAVPTAPPSSLEQT